MITWVARVRAAAPGTAIRKIAYARGAFEPHYHLEAKLFRNGREDLTAVVRQIAANANCEGYIVATEISAALESTNQTLTGIGVYKSWASPSKRGVVVANFNLTVFDGRTFDVHRAPLPDFGAVVASAFVRPDDALRILNDLEFPTSPEQAANNAMLHDGARNLITARLGKVLARLSQGRVKGSPSRTGPAPSRRTLRLASFAESPQKATNRCARKTSNDAALLVAPFPLVLFAMAVGGDRAAL
jgi:hypothetical protein